MQDTPSLTPPGEHCGKLTKVLRFLQCPVLLLLRLGFGFQFMLTGWGKLQHVEKTAHYFSDLGIPMPTLNAYLAGCTECFGGTLLLVGLAARVVAVPLVFTMLVAYATAHRASVISIFHPTPDPKTQHIDGMIERLRNAFDQDAFPFLCAALVILAFGPGRLSLDYLLRKMFPCRTKTVEVTTKS